MQESKNISDHLANERTFLAWVRTSIGIMAFGFVVVKFSLFVKQLSMLLGSPVAMQSRGYSSLTGIILVAAGAVALILAYIRYRKTERQIEKKDYRHSSLLINIITGFLLLVSAFLIVYLIETA